MSSSSVRQRRTPTLFCAPCDPLTRLATSLLCTLLAACASPRGSGQEALDAEAGRARDTSPRNVDTEPTEDGEVRDSRDDDMSVATDPERPPLDASPVDATTGDDTEAGPQSPSAWSSYGSDLAQTRANAASIGVDNVAQLSALWSWTKAAVTSTPVVQDGTVYFGDWQGYVVALDARTGTERWRVLAPEQAVQQITGSAAVEDDAVYVGGDSAMLYRLDARTGAMRWTTQLNSGGSTHTYASPSLVDGLAILGVASYQNVNPLALDQRAFQGNVVAVDVDSGKIAWEQVLTDETGVGVVSSVAVDTPRRMAFVGSGQNYSGSSPYADALLALDLDTGAVRWHEQFTADDIYSLARPDGADQDVLATPLLYSAGGTDLVAAADKAGAVYVFERETGKPVWQRALTAGGHFGGVMGSPAYHDGTLFVCSGNHDTAPPVGIGQASPAQATLFALDGLDGDVEWSTDVTGACYGSISYANGLVYLPAVDGNLHIYDAGNGKEVWSAPLGQSAAGGVSVVGNMVFVSYGWDWLNPAVPGGVRAFALPE